MQSLEEVRAYFRNDRFAAAAGCVIDEVGEKSAKCSMILTDQHRNAMGGVMGGAIFTLADLSFAVACNWENPGTVAISVDISYLSAPKGGVLYAEAVCVKDGRSTCFYRISVRDELGTPVAELSATGFHLKK